MTHDRRGLIMYSAVLEVDQGEVVCLLKIVQKDIVGVV